ncbi:MAG: DUF3047 domain-containing protein [Nitrospiria bacterium]
MKRVIYVLVIVFPLIGLIQGSAVFALLGAQGDSIVLEDFSSHGANGLPEGWKAQNENPKPAEVYKILKETDVSYLYANGRPNRIFKKMKWNPNEYPYITWRWRMVKVPDDPEKERSANLYVSLGTDLIGIPKITKYAWSSLKKAGSEVSGGFFRPTTIVLRSGSPQSGEWVTETLNVLEDYRRLHQEDPPTEAYGIGILTTIEAEFAEIIAHK